MLAVELARTLSRDAFAVIRHGDFDAFKQLTRSRSRTIISAQCAMGAYGVEPKGFSFWLHEGPEVTIVGFWNGSMFRVWNPDPEWFVTWITRPDLQTTVPTSLPDDVADGLQAMSCQDIAVGPVTPRPLPDLLKRWRSEIDEIIVSSDDLVTLRQGAAVAQLRVPHQRRRRISLLLCHDNWTCTADHARLVVTVLDGLTAGLLSRWDESIVSHIVHGPLLDMHFLRRVEGLRFWLQRAEGALSTGDQVAFQKAKEIARQRIGRIEAPLPEDISAHLSRLGIS